MNDILWIVIAVVLVVLMVLGNRKVRLLSLFIKQIQVFKNAKNNRISIWDLLCFIVFPLLLSLIIVYKFDVCINETLSGILSTVFSLMFTVLFGFATIIVGKMDSENILEKQIVGETFISIMSATVLSLISVIGSIIVIGIKDSCWINIVSAFVFSVSIIATMLLLLVSKRTFVIYNNASKH